MSDKPGLKFHEDLFRAALDNASVASSILDDLEPMGCPDEYRRGFQDAAKRFYYLLNSALSWVVDSRAPRVAALQCGYALGSAVTGGEPMETVAKRHAVTRACLSKGSRAFCKQTGIEPVGSLKASTSNYREARLRSIQLANARAGHAAITTTKKKETSKK